MTTETDPARPARPVTIDSGPVDWQILQQDRNGLASITLAGRWNTLVERRKPEVQVRICREGDFGAITRGHDWTRARTRVDRSVTGDDAGKSGRWTLTLENIPRGGPYRLVTTVGSAEDAIEWRRGGDVIHFFGVGDLWLIAGQSNAEGYGRDPVDDPAEIGIHQFDGRGWRLAAHGQHHSPWLAFAKQLKKELGYPIGLIPTAVGGSAVSQWDPAQKGALYAIMQRRLRDAGASIKGCVWYQGESDVGAGEHPTYKARFSRFLKGLRRTVKQAGLPVITVQLNRVLGAREDGAGWEAIREIQRQVSHEEDGVFVIPIFEAGLCDGIHISSLGNLLVAQRAAATALGGVYGHEIDYRHPECKSVRKRSGKVLELCFEHVVERLDYECALSNGFAFAVRDAEGEVPIAGYTLPRNDVIRIELARSLSIPATVTGAPGCCPPQVVPRDISGYRGMLGFTRAVECRNHSA
jgi:sialate O-acetylesterase